MISNRASLTVERRMNNPQVNTDAAWLKTVLVAWLTVDAAHCHLVFPKTTAYSNARTEFRPTFTSRRLRTKHRLSKVQCPWIWNDAYQYYMRCMNGFQSLATSCLTAVIRIRMVLSTLVTCFWKAPVAASCDDNISKRWLSVFLFRRKISKYWIIINLAAFRTELITRKSVP